MTTERTRLHERVVGELARRVVSGEWPPGYLVPTEAELCVLLGVSRTALREGVRLLDHRGLLVVRQGKGTVVAPRAQWNLIDPLVLSEGLCHGVPDIVDYVLEVRLLLEPVAIGLCAERATAAQRDQLNALMEDLRAHISDPPVYARLASRFHEELVVAAGNSLLERMIAPLHEALHVWRLRLETVLPSRQVNHEGHERILAAVQAHDKEGATHEAAEHLRTTFALEVRAAQSLTSQAAAGRR